LDVIAYLTLVALILLVGAPGLLLAYTVGVTLEKSRAALAALEVKNSLPGPRAGADQTGEVRSAESLPQDQPRLSSPVGSGPYHELFAAWSRAGRPAANETRAPCAPCQRARALFLRLRGGGARTHTH
jgi:hypothetical protein